MADAAAAGPGTLTTSTLTPGTLITVAPAPGPIGHLLRTAIDAEQVGAARLHLPTGQPDLLLAVSALREQTSLVLTCDEPVQGPATITSGFVDAEVPDGPDLPAVVTQVARLVAMHPHGVGLHGRGAATLPVLLAALAAGGHLLVGAPGDAAAGSRTGRDHVALVARASGLARIAGRPPLPPAAARALLGLS
jgi:hypothetical protein